MNRKQLAIILVLLVVLGIAGIMVYQGQNKDRRSANPTLGKKLLGDFPVNDVTQIVIKQGTNEVHLAKQDDLWRVQERSGYPANYQELSDFVLKARDLKVVQAEQVGPSQLPRLALTTEGTNSATVVEFKDKNGKNIQTMLLGKKHMRKSARPSPMGDMGMGDEGWPDGRYVKTASDSGTVALISDPLSNVEPKPEQWLNKDFVKVEKIRSIGVTFPSETNSWQLVRDTENGEWKLAEAKPEEKLDTSKASSATSSLSSPSFSDVSPAEKAAQMGITNATTVKIETFDNFDYTFTVGHKTNDNYPVMVSVAAKLPAAREPGKDEKPEDKEKLDKEFKEKQQKLQEKLDKEKAFDKWVYLVSSWTFDSVLKDRAQLMAEKKEEPVKTGETNAAGDHAHADLSSASPVLANELPIGNGSGTVVHASTNSPSSANTNAPGLTNAASPNAAAEVSALTSPIATTNSPASTNAPTPTEENK